MNLEEKDHLQDAHLIEEKLSGRLVHNGVFFEVFQDRVRLPDGRESVREYIRHPGAAVILPLLDDGRVLLVRQFRYTIGKIVLEFPAGKLDLQEDPLVCAQRELREETGYSASDWQHVCTVHNALGYSDEALYFYLARGLKLEDALPHPDAEEFIEPFSATLAELTDWVEAGQVTDVKTVVGTFWLKKIHESDL